MPYEPATIIGIELGAVTFFMLLLPLVVVLHRLPAVWRSDPGAALLLGGVVALTGLSFLAFFAGFLGLLFSMGA